MMFSVFTVRINDTLIYVWCVCVIEPHAKMNCILMTRSPKSMRHDSLWIISNNSQPVYFFSSSFWHNDDIACAEICLDIWNCIVGLKHWKEKPCWFIFASQFIRKPMYKQRQQKNGIKETGLLKLIDHKGALERVALCHLCAVVGPFALLLCLPLPANCISNPVLFHSLKYQYHTALITHLCTYLIYFLSWSFCFFFRLIHQINQLYRVLNSNKALGIASKNFNNRNSLWKYGFK